MNPRIMLVGGFLLGLVLERAAYFASRSALVLFMIDDLGMSVEHAVEAYAVLVWGRLFSPLLGGLSAIFLGPRVTAVLGLLVAIVGQASLVMTDSGPPMASLVLVAVSAGLIYPAVFVALAQEVGFPRDNARTAIFFVVLAATDVGGFVGGFVSALPDYRALFGVNILVLVTAGLILGGVARKWRPVDRPEPPSLGGRAELGALLLLVLLVPYYVGMSALGVWEDAAFDSMWPGDSMWPRSISALADVLATVALIAFFFALVRKRSRPLALQVVGGGLLLGAVGLCLSSFHDWESEPGLALLAGGALATVGRVAVTGAVMARIAAGSDPRFATLVFAAFFIAAEGMGFVGSYAGLEDARRIVIIVASVLMLAGGIAFLAFADRARLFLYTPRDQAPG